MREWCDFKRKEKVVVGFSLLRMKGKRSGAEFEKAMMALCTDENTKEEGMIERFVVVGKTVRMVLKVAKGRRAKEAERFLKSKFAEGAERLSGGLREQHMAKS